MKSAAGVITGDVFLVNPEQNINEAALPMREMDVGSVAVHSDNMLVGTLTDRDIAVRAVATGTTPAVEVREVMSNDMKDCFDDQDIHDVASNIAALGIRRLPVINREKRLLGIVALSNIASSRESRSIDVFLNSVACPH